MFIKKVNEFDKSNYMVNEFIKRIYELDESKNSLENKINHIDCFLNNLIDFCIKKKIFYFVENKISYTDIYTKFKYHLAIFIKNLIDPTNNIIDKYIINNNKSGFELNLDLVQESELDSISKTKLSNNNNWNNISDIDSLIFKNYKKLGKSSKKNVSFEDNLQITNYDEIANENNFECNILADSTNNVDNIKNLPLYIKILINQNKYLVEFIDKLNQMCKILSDPDIKYNKSCPYDNN